jgi:hypothetical protein
MAADPVKYDVMQLEKPVEKKIADTTKNSASNKIKKNVDQFFTAFGKLFEHKKNKKNNAGSGKKGISNKTADTEIVASSSKRMKEVFGIYPYWLEDSIGNYNCKLLSSIAYFGYELDPYTGKYKYIKNWKTTKLIDVAKANNTKVYLTVTNLS